MEQGTPETNQYVSPGKKNGLLYIPGRVLREDIFVTDQWPGFLYTLAGSKTLVPMTVPSSVR
jgi:hypothetical protein